ncbi:MAG TPA: CBS domain-containing protein [bacterium]|nr:CBS domain-containing protein [bacterium]
MTLGDIMSNPVILITLDNTLGEAADLMQRSSIRHLLVIDSETRALKGIITDRDLRKHLSPMLGTEAETEEDRKTLQTRVHKVMVRRLVTATPETSIREGARLLITKKIGCLPIVDNNRRLFGILTESDFVRLLAEKVAVIPYKGL